MLRDAHHINLKAAILLMKLDGFSFSSLREFAIVFVE